MRHHTTTLVLALLLVLVSLPAFAGNKVDVCHVTGSGSVLTLNVSENAVPAHLGHGDYLPLTFYTDADGDGFGDPASSVKVCETPAGYVADATDCDDGDAATNPGAEEVPGDGVDNDCNPETSDDVCPCFYEENFPPDATHVAGHWLSAADGSLPIVECIELPPRPTYHGNLAKVEDAFFLTAIFLNGVNHCGTGDSDEMIEITEAERLICRDFLLSICP